MENIKSIWIDPAGFISFRFDTWTDRSTFLENYVPKGEVFSNARYNTEDPPWRLTFNLAYLSQFTLQEQT